VYTFWPPGARRRATPFLPRRGARDRGVPRRAGRFEKVEPGSRFWWGGLRAHGRRAAQRDLGSSPLHPRARADAVRLRRRPPTAPAPADGAAAADSATSWCYPATSALGRSAGHHERRHGRLGRHDTPHVAEAGPREGHPTGGSNVPNRATSVVLGGQGARDLPNPQDRTILLDGPRSGPPRAAREWGVPGMTSISSRWARAAWGEPLLRPR